MPQLACGAPTLFPWRKEASKPSFSASRFTFTITPTFSSLLSLQSIPFNAMEADPKAGEAAPTVQDFPLYLDLGTGLTAKLEEHNYAVLVDHRLKFNARCLGFGIK
ncbi:unnamed protein product [Closterium sp. NIES-54]